MDSKSSKNLKSYKTAATLSAISGLLFIIVGVVSGKIGVFLPIGIALGIISIGFWEYSKKQWRKEYNQVRSHSALGYRPPAPVSIMTEILT